MAPPIDASKVLIEELTLLIADISSVADEEARLAEAEEECKAQAKQAKQVAEQTAASQRQAGIEAMQKKVKRRSRLNGPTAIPARQRHVSVPRGAWSQVERAARQDRYSYRQTARENIQSVRPRRQ
mmetsp:Transcript_24285/g.65198  ORF Transcript_24285/g.65198 Transcript_24285/m.65198 type:complete len:126 (+) Transcript_24285:22-399(+)|eukprot:1228838-Prymnesium_polylepis.2